MSQMTTYKSAHTSCKAKVRGLCLVLLLCFHLAEGDVPGPCKYSVRKDHLATIGHLIENQLQNGCSIIYAFTERGSLSNRCYVKAALPKILELIDTHFRYAWSSDNGRYVVAVKALIHNLYSQKCIPPIDEELEEDPAKFSKVYRGSPREALEWVQEVFSIYLELISTNNTPVDWNCEDEYAEDESEFTTPLAQTTGNPPHSKQHTDTQYRSPPRSPDSAANLPSSDPQDSRKHFQSGGPGISHDSHTLAFVMAPVCGGLLLIPALYWLRRQKKLQDLLQSFQMTENCRLIPQSTNLEMQDCETMVQACLPSPYSGQLQNQGIHL